MDIYQQYKDIINKYRPDTIDKSTWISAHGLIKLVTKEFDRDGISKRVAEKRGITQEEVLKEWEKEGAIAIEKGNIVHHAIKSNFQEFEIGQYTPKEIGKQLSYYALNYLNDLGAECIAQEKFITYKPKKMYGFFDYLLWSKVRKKVILVDWKTNKEIDKFNQWETFKKPFEMIDASKANIYSLQQSFYKYILLKAIGIKVDELHIVWLNEHNKNYEIIDASDMSKVLDTILDLR